MARINMVIPDDLDTRFRTAVAKKKGLRKGAISDALVEAVELWLKRHE